jgi:multiple sugar transport system ATP-binding protein
MSRVELRGVSKDFGKNAVLRGVNLDIPDKELFVLVGPSGSGKSTLLRLIAGLEESSEGHILIDGHVVNGTPPRDRNIAMVFQNYALYPHMSVSQNMSFGLTLRGYSQKEISARVQEAAEILDIGPLLDRRPGTLSGGERQRAALGRAIVRKPKVFLFDEPLSNLDAKLRLQMRAELIRLHKRLQTTMIYVTHDQVEAMTLGHQISVIRDGVIQQTARPLELYHYPVNRFVGEFIGQPTMNFFHTTVLAKDGRLWLDQGHFQLQLPLHYPPGRRLQAGQRVWLGIRPQHIADRLFQPAAAMEGNRVLAIVEFLEPLGSETYIHLIAGGSRFVIRADTYNPVQTNQPIEVAINMDHIHLFAADETGARIEG